MMQLVARLVLLVIKKPVMIQTQQLASLLILKLEYKQPFICYLPNVMYVYESYPDDFPTSSCCEHVVMKCFAFLTLKTSGL